MRFVDRLHQHAKRVIPSGSFILPFDLPFALGRGDGELGDKILHAMFNAGRYSPDMPRVLPPEIVRNVGNGSIEKGRKVIEEFIERSRDEHHRGKNAPEAPHDELSDGGSVKSARVVFQPDGIYAVGSGAVKASMAEVRYRPGIGARRCELCTMFEAPNECSAVSGQISAAGFCDLYESAVKQTNIIAVMPQSRHAKPNIRVRISHE